MHVSTRVIFGGVSVLVLVHDQFSIFCGCFFNGKNIVFSIYFKRNFHWT